MSTDVGCGGAWPRSPPGPGSRRSPYNELPPLPPSTSLETPAILKATLKARTALSALDRLAAKLPNPGILVRTLPLMEARCSSEIENIVTTDDVLFRSADLHDETSPPAVREASRHAEALLEGYHGLPKLPVCTRVSRSRCARVSRDTPCPSAGCRARSLPAASK
jgi:Fic family protein